MDKVIWIINNYASHLESRHLELSRQFAKHGYKTVVITSSFHHGKKEYIYNRKITSVERNSGVYFVYLKAEPVYAGNGARRVLNMIHFTKMVVQYRKEFACIFGKPDYVIGSSAHPFVWEAAYVIAKNYNARFIAEFRDIWPMSLVEIQKVSPKHPFVLLLSIIEKRAYKRADAIVSTMPYAYKHVCDSLGFPRNKMHWLPNGINVDEYEDNIEKHASFSTELKEYLDNHWCCVYVGSIVKSECLDFLLDVWKKVNKKTLYFAVVGEGAEKEHIEKRIVEEKISNIRVFKAVKSTEVPAVLSKAHCCIAALSFGELGKYGLSKYKLNDYLLSGKPTIFACDYPNVVAEAGHFSLPLGNEKRVADTIIEISEMEEKNLQQLSEQGKNMIRSNYDYSVLGKQYIDLLESL